MTGKLRRLSREPRYQSLDVSLNFVTALSLMAGLVVTTVAHGAPELGLFKADSGVLSAPTGKKSVNVTPPGPTSQEDSADLQMLQDVSRRLLAVASRRPGRYLDKYVWPPSVEFQNSRQVNAYASIWYQQEDGKWVRPVDAQTGKFKPHVVVYQALMNDLIEREPDRLAFVLGHELSHILLGHVLPTSAASTARTPTLSTVFTAEQEHEADILGMKLALAANYSIQGARQVWLRVNSEAFLMRQPGWRNYTSFEGVGINHPSWTDRLALIDKEKAALWKAMSAFENGVFFLNVQQYAAAEESFSRVINDTAFPGSYDAWTDLGYARLMQYLDKLDAQDIARFKVSQLVVGSFYARPQTLAAQVRGVDTDLWDKSVAATRRALELNPDSTLAKANLGIAYLLSPTGSNVPEATRYLEQAASAAPADRDLSGANRVSILINSAVALLAGGKTDKALARLAQADDLLKDGEAVPALNYNRALALSNSSDLEDHKQAERFLETYLRTESPASLWWESGYALYSKLSEELKQSARTKQEFKEMAQVKLRPVTSVDLGRGLIVTLSDPLTTVKQKLGETQNVPVVSGTNLVRLFYPQRGVELLATRLVVAIFLRGVAAPPLQIQGAGAGSSVSLLRVGMSEEEVLKLLGGDFQVAPLAESDVLYHFYPEVGVAVRFDGRGRVEEMAIAQITVAER